MGDHVIEVRVDDKIAYVVGDPLYVCGNSDYIVNFTFDADWADHEVKTARFIKNNKEYIDVVFSGSRCAVPIIENTTHVRIGVYAGNLCTTTAAIVNAQRSILCGSGTPANPHDDVYSQIMKNMDEIIARGTVSDEAIAGVVKDYLDENPVLGASPEEAAQIAANKHAIETMTAETIGAAPASHAVDKNNPHDVTIEQIGAAPAGYGLGGVAKKLTSDDNLDDVWGCGYYSWYNQSPMNAPYFDGGGGANFAVMHVTALDKYSFVQEVTYIYYGQPNLTQKRTKTDTLLGEWEWANPPMSLGVEYRTTERHNGKAVYVQAVSFGALPNAEEKLVSYSSKYGTVGGVLCVYGYTSGGITLPYNSSYANYRLYASTSAVGIETDADKSSQTAIVIVKYCLM